jgi:hypothetical protein
MLVQCSPESDTVGMGKIVQGTAMVRFCLIGNKMNCELMLTYDTPLFGKQEVGI